MSWLIEGGDSNVGIGISNNANRKIWATARSHKPPVLDTNPYTALTSLEPSKCHWSIQSSDASALELIDENLIAVAKKYPDKPHAVIQLFQEPESIGIGIVLPRPLFENVWELYLTVLNNATLAYSINVELVRFGDESTSASGPTLKEFLSGKPYLTNEVSFSLGKYVHRA